MGLIDFIRRFAPENGNVENTADGVAQSVVAEPMNNQTILNNITRQFERELKANSFEDVVTFPMSFTIILNMKDYYKQKDYTPLIAQKTVEAFYRIIKENMKDGKKCANLATWWNISFVPCETEGVQVNENMIVVEEGKYAICCAVHDKVMDFKDSEDGSGSQFSVTVGGSTIYGNINFNRERLANLKVVSDTHFNIDWDPDLSEVVTPSMDKTANLGTPVAKLCCQGKEFNLIKGTYMVSGTTETRKDKNIFVVDSDYVENGHIRIQYIEKDNKFKIAAFGDTKLNDEEMQKSTATDMVWMDLLDNTFISLADDIDLTFRTMI